MSAWVERFLQCFFSPVKPPDRRATIRNVHFSDLTIFFPSVRRDITTTVPTRSRLRLFVSVYTRYITAQTSEIKKQESMLNFFFLVVVGAQL